MHSVLLFVNVCFQILSPKQGISKAEASTPSCLKIKTSGILGAGQGVFATQYIPTRTKFGPYKGEIMRDIDKAHSTGYSWQVRSETVSCKMNNELQ